MTVQNMPTGIDTDDVSLGQHVLYWSYYTVPTGSGVTPTTSIGAIQEGNIEFNTESIKQEQGFPRQINKKWPKRQSAVYTATIWERDQARFMMMLGCGSTPGTSNEFGGDSSFKEYSFVIEHKMTGGQTEYFDIFRATREGPVTISHSAEDENLIEISFEAHFEAKDWLNAAFRSSRYVLVRRRQAAA